MTHGKKIVGRQKRNLLNKFQLSTKNSVITTCPNRCEKWVFLSFLEFDSSYITNSGDQSNRQK